MIDIQALFGLRLPPIAIGFLSQPPEGVPLWEGGQVPAGCSFWKAAQQGKTFYTTPADHYNCAVGAYTHKITLPMDRSEELMGTISLMVENDYLAMSEVPGIPTLPETPAVIAYGPVLTAPFPPSIVLVVASPAQAMLLYEAAIRAGAAPALMNALGRPACAVLPLSVQTDASAFSLGCAGNRQFTGIDTGEMYLAVPGERWNAVAEQALNVHQANANMGAFYANKQTQFVSV